jgi:hypothetical protein
MSKTDWRAIVHDSRHRRAFEALEDPQWDWRTATAIAKASGLSEEEVAQLVDLYPVLVRRSLAPGKTGEHLYTLQSKYLARQSPVRKIWTFLSSNSSTNLSGSGDAP